MELPVPEKRRGGGWLFAGLLAAGGLCFLAWRMADGPPAQKGAIPRRAPPRSERPPERAPSPRSGPSSGKTRLCPATDRAPSPEYLQAIERLRSLAPTPNVSWTRDDAFERQVKEALDVLREGAPSDLGALLAVYRETPRPGSPGDARVRAALLYVLAETRSPALDAEASDRLEKAILSPESAERSDVRYLLYAARRSTRPEEYRGIARLLPLLSGKELGWALEALSGSPCAEDLPLYASLGEAAWTQYAPRLIEIGARCPAGSGLPWLRRTAEVRGAQPGLLAGIAAVGTPDAAGCLMDLSEKLAEAPGRADAVKALTGMFDAAALFTGRGGVSWGAMPPLGRSVEDRIMGERSASLPQTEMENVASLRTVCERLGTLAAAEREPEVLLSLCGAFRALRLWECVPALTRLENSDHAQVRAAAAAALAAIRADPRD